MDVYGFSLNREQITASSIWIINDGDPTSINGIQIGWEVITILCIVSFNYLILCDPISGRMLRYGCSFTASYKFVGKEYTV